MWVKVLRAMADVCGGELGQALSLGMESTSGAGGAGRVIWEFRTKGIRGHIGLELCCQPVSDRLNGLCGDGVRPWKWGSDVHWAKAQLGGDTNCQCFLKTTVLKGKVRAGSWSP